MEEHIQDITFTVFQVKYAGLAVLDATLTAQGNWTALYKVTRNLVADLRYHAKLRSGDYLQLLTNVRVEIRR